jgi:hypothetical protein
VEGHLRAIASEPDRSLGTRGEARTADYCGKFFKKLPDHLNATVGSQDFITPVRVFEGASLSVGGASLPLHPLFANALAPESLEAGHEGGLVFVGEGRLEDFDGKDVAGSIVLMYRRLGGGWLHAANLGARALVYLDRGGETAPRLRYPRTRRSSRPWTSRGFWVRAEDFEAGLGLAGGRLGPRRTPAGQRAMGQGAQLQRLVPHPGNDATAAGELLVVEAFLDGRYVPGHALPPTRPCPWPPCCTWQTASPLTPRGARFCSWRRRATATCWPACASPYGHDRQEEGYRRGAGGHGGARRRRQVHGRPARTGAAPRRPARRGRPGPGGHPTEIRNEVERINIALRLAPQGHGANAARIRELAARKLLLRRIGWEGSFAGLDELAQEAVRGFVPARPGTRPAPSRGHRRPPGRPALGPEAEQGRRRQARGRGRVPAPVLPRQRRRQRRRRLLFR